MSAVVVGLLGIVTAAHYRVAILGETWVARDALEIMMPSRAFLSAALRSGYIPEWCDSIGIGTPFAANPLNGVTYPPY